MVPIRPCSSLDHGSGAFVIPDDPDSQRPLVHCALAFAAHSRCLGTLHHNTFIAGGFTVNRHYGGRNPESDFLYTSTLRANSWLEKKIGEIRAFAVLRRVFGVILLSIAVKILKVKRTFTAWLKFLRMVPPKAIQALVVMAFHSSLWQARKRIERWISRLTTNNRMELMAVIVALRSIKKWHPIKVVTDSQYVANAISKGWLWNWERKISKTKPTKICGAGTFHYKNWTPNWFWVKGHAGHAENRRCDQLAVKSGHGGNPSAMKAYEELSK